MKNEYGHNHTRQDRGQEHRKHAEGHEGHPNSGTAAEIDVEWRIRPQRINPEEVTEVTITIKNKKRGPSPAFALVHEQQMHLLTISKDLSSFQHLHPEYIGNGVFGIRMQFPKAGIYRMYAEFMPEGSAQQLATYEIHVAGKELNKSVNPDELYKKTINELHFELKAGQLATNQDVELSFCISDANTGGPVANLEPYLGSAGHVVIVSADLKKFLHVHPTDEASKGPAISYITSFPEPGIYKIWGQFKYKSRLYTVSFVVNVT